MENLKELCCCNGEGGLFEMLNLYCPWDFFQCCYCAKGHVIGKVKKASHFIFESSSRRLGTSFGALVCNIRASEIWLMRHMSRR